MKTSKTPRASRSSASTAPVAAPVVPVAPAADAPVARKLYGIATPLAGVPDLFTLRGATLNGLPLPKIAARYGNALLLGTPLHAAPTLPLTPADVPALRAMLAALRTYLASGPAASPDAATFVETCALHFVSSHPVRSNNAAHFATSGFEHTGDGLYFAARAAARVTCALRSLTLTGPDARAIPPFAGGFGSKLAARMFADSVVAFSAKL